METSYIAVLCSLNTQCSIKVVKEGCNINGRIVHCICFILLDLDTGLRKDQLTYAFILQIGVCYTWLITLWLIFHRKIRTLFHKRTKRQ